MSVYGNSERIISERRYDKYIVTYNGFMNLLERHEEMTPEEFYKLAKSEFKSRKEKLDRIENS